MANRLRPDRPVGKKPKAPSSKKKLIEPNKLEEIKIRLEIYP